MSTCVVCFPMSHFEGGGLERVQTEIASGLAKSGFQIELVTREIGVGPDNLHEQGLTIQALGGGKLRFLYRLSLWIRKKNANVIFTSANDIGVFLLLFRKALVPFGKVVWCQHSSLSGPLAISSGFRKLKLLVEIFMMRLMINKSDAIVAVSNAVASDMRRVLGGKLNIQVIYNPVITVDFNEKVHQVVQWPWDDCALPVIVFVGRLAKIKRIDLLIQAFSVCSQAMPARLLIIGDGPEACGAARLAESLSLGESCKFIGYQANPLPWIRGSDLLVLCSDSEGFGLVLVEAMACGTQVLATDCPDGPAELLANGKYGRLVATGDIDALASAMEESLRNPLVSEDALKARAAEFDGESAVSDYLSLINDLQRK